jgi:hypothetical protein
MPIPPTVQEQFMTRLARSASRNISIERDGDSCHVTMLFDKGRRLRREP